MVSKPPRWNIIDIKEQEHKIIVHDSLFNKARTYVVPNLTTANLYEDRLYVNTNSGKLMRIDLPSGSRRFVKN
jgi:hypothetical protein